MRPCQWGPWTHTVVENKMRSSRYNCIMVQAISLLTLLRMLTEGNTNPKPIVSYKNKTQCYRKICTRSAIPVFSITDLCSLFVWMCAWIVSRFVLFEWDKCVHISMEVFIFPRIQRCIDHSFKYQLTRLTLSFEELKLSLIAFQPPKCALN